MASAAFDEIGGALKWTDIDLEFKNDVDEMVKSPFTLTQSANFHSWQHSKKSLDNLARLVESEESIADAFFEEEVSIPTNEQVWATFIQIWKTVGDKQNGYIMAMQNSKMYIPALMPASKMVYPVWFGPMPLEFDAKGLPKQVSDVLQEWKLLATTIAVMETKGLSFDDVGEDDAASVIPEEWAFYAMNVPEGDRFEEVNTKLAEVYRKAKKIISEEEKTMQKEWKDLKKRLEKVEVKKPIAARFQLEKEDPLQRTAIYRASTKARLTFQQAR